MKMSTFFVAFNLLKKEISASFKSVVLKFSIASTLFFICYKLATSQSPTSLVL